VLGREILVSHLHALLERLTQPGRSSDGDRLTESAVVHMDGRWGSGKSTLVTLLLLRRLRAGTAPTGATESTGAAEPASST